MPRTSETNIRTLPLVTGRLPRATRVPERVRRQWAEDAKRFGLAQPGYSNRWHAFWIKVVRAAATYGPMGDVDVALIEEYVARLRLAELHLLKARAEPYSSSPSGMIHAHPGFAQSRAEAKAAREVADGLGLTPYVRRRAGALVPPATAEGDDPPGPEVPAVTWADDQRGPEGDRL